MTLWRTAPVSMEDFRVTFENPLLTICYFTGSNGARRPARYRNQGSWQEGREEGVVRGD